VDLERKSWHSPDSQLRSDVEAFMNDHHILRKIRYASHNVTATHPAERHTNPQVNKCHGVSGTHKVAPEAVVGLAG
jgi:hypothetical protein